jgi:hypothetical protein
MRVLLDECMPRDFKKHLRGHECFTAPEAGLAGKKNGELLRAAAGRFDALVTVDKKLRYQQNLARVPFGVIVLMTRGNRLEDLMPLVGATLTALQSVNPGQVIEIGA